MTGVSIRGAGTSPITYRVGGREYPLKTNRQCRTCMSPYRFDVEEGLISGRTYAKIIEHLPDDADLSTRNVMDHYRHGHLPLEISATRAIVEKRAEAVGKRIEDEAGSLVDGITLLETVVERTFRAIASGEIQPDVADGVRAARILAALGEFDEAGLDQQAVIEAFMAYHEEAERLMPPELFEQFGERLNTNPVLRALAAKYGGEPDTVAGESEEVRTG